VRTEFSNLRRAARLSVNLARLVVDLRRGPAERHRARARLGAEWLRVTWSWKRLRIRRRPPYRSIIVIGLVEHLGDVVAAEPVARYLRSEYSDAYLVWAVRRSYCELLEHNPHLDAVIPLGCLTEWIHLAGSRVFDRVVDLQLQGRECAICRLPLEKPEGNRGVTFRTYYALGNLLHACCRAAGLPVLDGAPRVYIPSAVPARVNALRLPPAYAVIHCTSNQDERDWTAAKWRKLAEEIVASSDLEVVEVGLRPIVGGSLPGYTDLCGKLSILETAEVIRRAEVFIGIDSGPAHLANAAGTYGIILLGEYGPFKRYLPYSGGYADGSNAEILYAEEGPASTIPVQRVIEALHARLGSVRGGLV
jgi:heptosyltransferase-3